jgi:hypothetical protein
MNRSQAAVAACNEPYFGFVDLPVHTYLAGPDFERLFWGEGIAEAAPWRFVG